MSAALNRIGALARRDLNIEFTYQFQLILRFSYIVVQALTFFFLSRLVGDAEQLTRYDGRYFEFALIGLLVISFAVAIVTSVGSSIQSAQASGTFEILLSTSMGLPTLMIGTLMVPMLIAAVNAAVYLVLGWLLVGFTLPIAALPLVFALLILTLGTFAAVGVFSAAVIILAKRGDPFSALIIQASMLFAGALFPVTVLPDALQVVSRVVPAFYGLRGVREVVLVGGGFGEVATDLMVLLLFNLVLIPASLVVLSRAIRLARVTGTLGNR